MTAITHKNKPVATFIEYEDAVRCLAVMAKALNRTLQIDADSRKPFSESLPPGVVLDYGTITATPAIP
jgi:hypothetical protein